MNPGNESVSDGPVDALLFLRRIKEFIRIVKTVINGRGISRSRDCERARSRVFSRVLVYSLDDT